MASVTCHTCGEPSQGQEGRDRVTGHCALCVQERRDLARRHAECALVLRAEGRALIAPEHRASTLLDSSRAVLVPVLADVIEAALREAAAHTPAKAPAPPAPVESTPAVQPSACAHAHRAMEALDQAEHLPDELSSDDLSAIKNALAAAFDAGREVRLEAPNTSTQQAREAGADAELVRITTLLSNGVQEARRKAERLADDAKRETRHADMLEAAFTEIELDRLLREGK